MNILLHPFEKIAYSNDFVRNFNRTKEFSLIPANDFQAYWIEYSFDGGNARIAYLNLFLREEGETLTIDAIDLYFYPIPPYLDQNEIVEKIFKHISILFAEISGVGADKLFEISFVFEQKKISVKKPMISQKSINEISLSIMKHSANYRELIEEILDLTEMKDIKNLIKEEEVGLQCHLLIDYVSRKAQESDLKKKLADEIVSYVIDKIKDSPTYHYDFFSLFFGFKGYYPLIPNALSTVFLEKEFFRHVSKFTDTSLEIVQIMHLQTLALANARSMPVTSPFVQQVISMHQTPSLIQPEIMLYKTMLESGSYDLAMLNYIDSAKALRQRRKKYRDHLANFNTLSDFIQKALIEDLFLAQSNVQTRFKYMIFKKLDISFSRETLRSPFVLPGAIVGAVYLWNLAVAYWYEYAQFDLFKVTTYFEDLPLITIVYALALYLLSVGICLTGLSLSEKFNKSWIQSGDQRKSVSNIALGIVAIVVLILSLAVGNIISRESLYGVRNQTFYAGVFVREDLSEVRQINFKLICREDEGCKSLGMEVRGSQDYDHIISTDHITPKEVCMHIDLLLSEAKLANKDIQIVSGEYERFKLLHGCYVD